MRAIRMKTADMYHPIGIDIRNPRLSWNCEGGISQSAYRVVAKSATGCILWDSGRQNGNSMHCVYDGEKLESRMRVEWQVCLWDETGREEWSEEACFETGLLEEEDWKAKWICGIDTDRRERLPADYYKKEFIVNNAPVRARLYATALGVYTARINGIKVSSVLAPGTTQYNKRLYYQTYDITEQILAGGEQSGCINTVEFCVGDGWYKGKLGADQTEYLFGSQTKLLAQIELEYGDGRLDIIGTDDSFLWSNDGPIRFSDLKDGEIYDAARCPSYADHAQETSYNVQPTASNAPCIREQETFRAKLEISPNGAQILNFGQNIAGYIRFRTDAKAGTQIRVRMFEAADHGEYSDISLSFQDGNVEPVKQEIVYIASGEKAEFIPEFFYSGFQYALVEGLERVNPDDFTAVAIYSDLEYSGGFTCSDEMINRFVQNTLWSMKGNFVDVPTDCPQREKAGWTGDAQVFCRTAAYFADTKAFFRKWFRDIKDCQRENGMVADVNPQVVEMGTQRDMVNGSCGWSDAAVIIPYTLWKMTGDSSVITDNYDVMSAWKKHRMEICRDKSMFHLPEGHPMKSLEAIYLSCKLEDSEWNRYIPESGVHWGEWSVPKSQEPQEMDPAMELIMPKQEVTCAYTHYSMKMLAEMLRQIGREKEAEECDEYAEGSRKAYHTHWVKDGKIHTEHMAELVRPIALGLLNDKEKEETAKQLNEMVIRRGYKVGTGFLSTPFLLQTLAETGYLETAYRMLENKETPGWLAMVAKGATTVWEDYECYSEDGKPLPHSFNHYSPGAVCAFLFDTVCGVRILGENELLITPEPGGSLTYAGADVLTAYGRIRSSWEKMQDGIKYSFEIPANVTARICLPDGTDEYVGAGKYEKKISTERFEHLLHGLGSMI